MRSVCRLSFDAHRYGASAAKSLAVGCARASAATVGSTSCSRKNARTGAIAGEASASDTSRHVHLRPSAGATVRKVAAQERCCSAEKPHRRPAKLANELNTSAATVKRVILCECRAMAAMASSRTTVLLGPESAMELILIRSSVSMRLEHSPSQRWDPGTNSTFRPCRAAEKVQCWAVNRLINSRAFW